MADVYPSHIRKDAAGETVQTNSEHCNNTAAYAEVFLSSVNLGNCGRLLGLLHDCGKYSDAFAEYIRAAADGKDVKRGSVNHSSAGLRYLLDEFHTANPNGNFTEKDIATELLAYAIGAHHGLFDCFDEYHQNGFERRKMLSLDYETVINRFFSNCTDKTSIKNLFIKSVDEIVSVLQHSSELLSEDENEFYFYCGLLARLLLSALIDADRTDTAEFMLNEKLSSFSEDMLPIWQKSLSAVETKLKEFTCDTPVKKARAAISDICVTAADKSSGIYRLNVPTGGGKTLTSLRYALAHALCNNKKRIIFTLPLLSILEQNAKVIRDFVGDDGIFLEHHSNVINTDSNESEEKTLDFLTESWNSPIIITTLVQLLNTMFSGKSSCVRRFHSLIDSVIVIDEVQTVPTNMITLFNLTVNFLSEICGATVVLCSATQPALYEVEHPLVKEPSELVPFNKELWQVFKRTDLCFAGKTVQSNLPGFAMNAVKDCKSLLVICNRKDEAAELYKALLQSDVLCFHLSAAMCIQHRRDTLDAVKKAISEPSSQKVICVSTQVIEAGVDISFEKVIRLAAGMDSIVQAAGRCNRNGESETPVPVQIVNCTDEKLSRLPGIQQGKAATIRLLNEFEKTPEKYDFDLASDKAVEFYYKFYYNQMKEGERDYAVNNLTLFDILSMNTKFCSASKCFMRQAFKTAGRLFTVFDEDTTTVITRYGRGEEITEALINENRGFDIDYQKIHTLIESAKPYTVSLYRYQVKFLEEQGALIKLFDDSMCILADGFYDENLGFVKEIIFAEV